LASGFGTPPLGGSTQFPSYHILQGLLKGSLFCQWEKWYYYDRVNYSFNKWCITKVTEVCFTDAIHKIAPTYLLTSVHTFRTFGYLELFFQVIIGCIFVYVFLYFTGNAFMEG
jgi:hypothetical protein